MVRQSDVAGWHDVMDGAGHQPRLPRDNDSVVAANDVGDPVCWADRVRYCHVVQARHRHRHPAPQRPGERSADGNDPTNEDRARASQHSGHQTALGMADQFDRASGGRDDLGDAGNGFIDGADPAVRQSEHTGIGSFGKRPVVGVGERLEYAGPGNNESPCHATFDRGMAVFSDVLAVRLPGQPPRGRPRDCSGYPPFPSPPRRGQRVRPPRER